MPTQQQNLNDVELQKNKVFGKKPILKLKNPCKINHGILEFSEEQTKDLIKKFDRNTSTVSFFIPASGSGSRMFQFLYEFLNQPDENNVQLIEKFFNNFQNFAFHRILPREIRQLNLTENPEIEKIINFILEEEGLNFSSFQRTNSIS